MIATMPISTKARAVPSPIQCRFPGNAVQVRDIRGVPKLFADDHLGPRPKDAVRAELAATVAFLLSDDASYVTSATLLVDAGFIVNAEL